MRWFRRMPISRKLTLIILLACTIALLLAGAALMGAEWVAARQRTVENLHVLADLLARNCAAPLAFHRDEDRDDARNALAAIAADSHIRAAGLYDKNGRLFAQFSPEPAQTPPTQVPPDGHRFVGAFLEVAAPVMEENHRLGTLFLRTDLGRISDSFRMHAGIVGLVLAVTIALAFLLSSLLRKPIADPILALARLARRVALERDFSVRAPRHGDDEIGTLTDALNQMLGEIESRQQSLEQANLSLARQARQLTESVHVVASAAREIQATSTALASGAAHTAAAVRQTTTTVQTVREATLAATRTANSVADGAQSVLDETLKGKSSVEQTIRGMDQIRRQVDSIADSMGRLSDQTQAIGEIIASVEDLTSRSNLLAVNASIEAAKAGDHGRGFMIVAQEVRSLAEQARAATTQVRGILSDIQKASHAAVIATEQGSKAAESGVRQSAQSGDSIESLSRNMGDAAQAARHIAQVSRQQLAGADQVAAAMNSIQAASSQNAASARQLETAAGNLLRLGEQMKACLAHMPDSP